MKDFTSIPKASWILETENFFAIKDGFPVSPGHCLIISKKVYSHYFELPIALLGELGEAIHEVKQLLEREIHPDGYNIGYNCGVDAGQTVMHFHCHVIPRYKGDMENPRGGVRYCIPEKGLY